MIQNATVSLAAPWLEIKVTDLSSIRGLKPPSLCEVGVDWQPGVVDTQTEQLPAKVLWLEQVPAGGRLGLMPLNRVQGR